MKPYSRCVWLTSCVSIEFISNEIVAMENAAESTDGITKRAVTDVSTTIGRLKSRLDLFDRKTISTTHKQVNVYESIGKLCFQNRAAVKLLNIDADIGFLLHTSAFNLPPDQLLYFLDICGGPGGFSEYMLFRNGWHAKGFGITLTDECDFNLHAFNVNAPKECFSPIYGPDGSGDITKFSNQEHLIVRVLDGTQDGRGVHVALADGGFSVIGHESDQEELSLRLYVSQCYVALATLRQGGIFICKLFDVYTNFSVGLVYLLYCCFEEICIYKPITSRPANSERYFVGKHLKQGPLHTILMYLQKIMHYDQLGSVDIVPRIILNADLYFCEYFRAQNGTIEDIQVESLRCIVDCLNDKALSPSSLSLDRTVHIDALLSAWNLAFNDNDHKTRTTQKHAELIFGQLVAPIDPSVVLERFLPAHKSSEWHTIHDRSSLPFSWYITPVAPDAQCTLFFCFIRGIIFSLQAHKWVYNSQTLLNIPPYTVVLGFVDGHTFVVLDAIVLGGESVLQLRLNERLQKIKLFCESTDRTYNETKDGSFYKTMRPAVFKAVEETPVFKTTGQTHVAIHVNSFSEKCLCKI